MRVGRLRLAGAIAFVGLSAAIAFTGVRSSSPKDTTTVMIWMSSDANDGQLRAVHSELGQWPQARKVSIVTSSETFRATARLFANEPNVLVSLRPDDAPSAFRVVVRNEAIDELLARFAAYPGVSNIALPQDVIPLHP